VLPSDIWTSLVACGMAALNYSKLG
jgi:hypothetical protein